MLFPTLKKHNRPGSYLIRFSSTKPDSVVLSGVRSRNGEMYFAHLRLYSREGRYYIKEDASDEGCDEISDFLASTVRFIF